MDEQREGQLRLERAIRDAQTQLLSAKTALERAQTAERAREECGRSLAQIDATLSELESSIDASRKIIEVSIEKLETQQHTRFETEKKFSVEVSGTLCVAPLMYGRRMKLSACSVNLRIDFSSSRIVLLPFQHTSSHLGQSERRMCSWLLADCKHNRNHCANSKLL